MKQTFIILLAAMFISGFIACDNTIDDDNYNFDYDRNAHKCLSVSYGSEDEVTYFTAKVDNIDNNTEKPFYAIGFHPSDENQVPCLMFFSGNYKINELDEIDLSDIKKKYDEKTCGNLSDSEYLDRYYSGYIEHNIFKYIRYHYYLTNYLGPRYPIDCSGSSSRYNVNYELPLYL